MSLVGPRPLDVREVARFAPWQLRRLAVKPGLTCLWQVSGRSDVGFEEWSRMDLWYVRNQSLKTDIELLWRTPMTVIGCKGGVLRSSRQVLVAIVQLSPMPRLRSRARRNGSHSNAGSSRHLQLKPPRPQRTIRPGVTSSGVTIRRNPARAASRAPR